MISKRVLFACLALMVFFASCKREHFHKLIEAESFTNKGGWVVDPQFVEQMGSPYLLAHGLGIPVENANLEFDLPSEGRYHVWARTKNWAPGKWEAPGRFNIIVNGKELTTILGTEEGWNWQYAGAVRCKETAGIIELKDLTGFDGRCDAIYFSTRKIIPPADLEELLQGLISYREARIPQAGW